mmetsp:Transcript_9743/g.25005  ORF Transcript_9743/g.25005 Transcript_9743/m.25005 type:complete len:271 (+) Transcript_9743:1069-1881(+)
MAWEASPPSSAFQCQSWRTLKTTTTMRAGAKPAATKSEWMTPHRNPLNSRKKKYFFTIYCTRTYYHYFQSVVFGKAMSRISLYVSANLMSRPSFTSSASSFTSLRFSWGMRMVFTPDLLAAMTFSLIPPTGRILPVSVTSPVIARSGRTLRPSARESSAVIIVQPAEGPSLGVAPAGTCTWILLFWKKSFSGSSCRRQSLAQACAIRALSFMTSPSEPVVVMAPRPSPRSTTLASTYRVEPPMAVQARPMTTPTGVWSQMRSVVKAGGPT